MSPKNNDKNFKVNNEYQFFVIVKKKRKKKKWCNSLARWQIFFSIHIKITRVRNSKVDVTDSAPNEILIDNVVKCNIRSKEKKMVSFVSYIVMVRAVDVPKIGLSYYK